MAKARPILVIVKVEGLAIQTAFQLAPAFGVAVKPPLGLPRALRITQ
jgi:hypothetical protein